MHTKSFNNELIRSYQMMLHDFAYCTSNYIIMLTDSRFSAASIYSRSECKPRYSSFITAPNLRDSRTSESTKKYQSPTLTSTPKKSQPTVIEQQTIRCRPTPIKYKPVFNTFNVLTLAFAVLVGVMACVCQINLEFQADARCWEKFKQHRCDINNPQGNQCIHLHECISEPQFEVSFGLIISAIISILFAIRFRKRLMAIFIKGLELWELLAWSKIEVQDEQ